MGALPKVQLSSGILFEAQVGIIGTYEHFKWIALSINIAQKPYILGSLGPTASKYESFEGKGWGLGIWVEDLGFLVLWGLGIAFNLIWLQVATNPLKRTPWSTKDNHT